MTQNITLINADVIDGLKSIDKNSIDTIVTSPPYHNLRNYQVTGQIGMEQTLEEFHDKLLAVTLECKRVLKPTGVMFWNHGDSYGGSGGSGGDYNTGGLREGQPKVGKSIGTTPKCLTMQNERLIIRMIDEQGFILRNRIIWYAPNKMPSSAHDRLTGKYEPVYMLVKNQKYHFDLDAIRIPAKYQEVWSRKGSAPGTPYETTGNNPRARWGLTKHEIATDRTSGTYSDPLHTKPVHSSGMKNPGDVFTIPTQPHKDAHFACVDEKTKVLTKDGWKLYNELSLNDEIATFDIVTEKIHYHKPYNIHIYNYNGTMIRIENTWIDQLVTPNHRLLLKYKHDIQKRIPDSNWHFINAKDIKPYSGILIPNAGIYSGEFSIGKHKAELLGWIISEAHIRKNGSIDIYQSRSANPDKVDRIKYLLNNTNQKYVYSERTRDYKGRDNIEVTFRLNKTQNDNSWIFKYINNKKQPTWRLLHLKKDEMFAIFNGLIDGDGHRRDDGRISFAQNDEYIHLWFRTLCTHLNVRTSLWKNTRISSCPTSHVTQRNNSQIHPSVFKNCVKDEDYKGIVWCPEVPNTNFICMRNGKISITGNSFPDALVEPLVKAGCPKNGIVLDPFAGSGTTLKVAKELGRSAIGIELSEEYCDIIKRNLLFHQYTLGNIVNEFVKL